MECIALNGCYRPLNTAEFPSFRLERDTFERAVRAGGVVHVKLEQLLDRVRISASPRGLSEETRDLRARRHRWHGLGGSGRRSSAFAGASRASRRCRRSRGCFATGEEKAREVLPIFHVGRLQVPHFARGILV